MVTRRSARSHFADLSRAYLPTLENYKWAKYLLMMWALRMSFFVVSLLFPILASLGAPQQTDSYQYQIPRIEFKERNFDELLSNRTPFVINNFSIPLGQAIGQVLDMELSKILTNVKVSESSEFTHFSPDQSWSVLLSQLRTYSVVNMDVNEFFDHRSNTSDSLFVYLSRQIRDPSTSIITQTLSPNLMLLPTGKGIIPEVRLWMSSKGVVATPHYDMEHNYFLQLNGTKKFIISSPIHLDVFQPFSYLHPCWRQSQQLHLLNFSSISTSPYFSETKRRRKKSSMTAAPSETSEYCPQNDTTLPHSSSVHEVLLHPGQLLYIPPFFYHSVTAMDEYSVSINAWVGSEYIQAAEKLRLQSPLPFHSNSEISAKLSSLGNLVTSLITRLALPFTLEELKNNLLTRANFHPLESEYDSQAASCVSHDPFSGCSDETVRVAGRIITMFPSLIPSQVTAIKSGKVLRRFLGLLATFLRRFKESFCWIILKKSWIPLSLPTPPPSRFFVLYKCVCQNNPKKIEIRIFLLGLSNEHRKYWSTSRLECLLLLKVI
jgi:hypothetical protein